LALSAWPLALVFMRRPVVVAIMALFNLVFLKPIERSILP
jgi:hypothetical protein